MPIKEVGRIGPDGLRMHWVMDEAKPAPKKRKGTPKKAPKAKAKKERPYVMSWLAALKKWNEGHGKWCIPRSGTDDYDEVERIRLGRK